MNILLVEDDPTDMKLLSAVLTSSGHTVVERISAEQAVETVASHQPEVILLDLKLPGMNGLALARRLKQDPATRHIPIVAVTAAREAFGREEALAAGCDVYILKPVDTRQFSEEILRTAARPAAPEQEA